MAYDGENDIVDWILNEMDGNESFVASRDGNRIYLTDIDNDSCYTITVHQDE